MSVNDAFLAARAIPSDLSVQLDHNRGTTKPIILEAKYSGIRYVVKFLWKQGIIHQTIEAIIDHTNLSNLDIECDFNTKFYTFWKNYLLNDYRLESVRFRSDELKSLRTINLINTNQNIDLIINRVHAKIRIDGFKKVQVLNSTNLDIVIQNSVDTELKNITYGTSVKSGQIQIIDCGRLILDKINHLHKLSLINQIDSIEISQCKIEDVSLLQTSFNRLEFYSSGINFLHMVGLNKNRLEGKIIFKLTEVKNLISMLDCQIGTPYPIKSFFENLFKSKKRLPIYFLINDTKFEPKEVQIRECEWHYNGIYDDADYPGGKRRLINQVKEYFKAKDDILNTQLLYSYEKNWYYNQNRFSWPLIFSKWSNNFGLNIWWPIFWIFFFVFLEALIVLRLSWNCYSDLCVNWGVFAHLINPTHSTSIFLEVLEGKCNPPIFFKNWLPVVDNSFRILVAYSIFQFANAFRYKFKLR